jgi:hypothetical protein
LFRGIFHSLFCQLSSLPREEFSKPLHRTRERPPHCKPAQERGITYSPGKEAPGHPNRSTNPLFSCSCPGIATPLFSEAFKALWDANSTPVCWGCQEGIPIYCISVLASGMLPLMPLFAQGDFSSSKIQVAHCSHATPDLPLFEFSVACQVAVQNLGAAHASISARAEVRRFRSEREKFRLSSRGHFSTAGPMAT